MMRSRQGFSFAKRGAAVMLAATLTAGMVPTMALAQVGDAGSAAASAVATGDGFYLEEGKSYSVPVAWLNASTGTESMAASYLSKTATVSYGNGVYDIRVSANDKGMSELLGMTYDGGTPAVSTGEGEFQILSNSLGGTIAVSLTIKTMQDMGMGAVGVNLSLDTSSLPTEAPEPPAPSVDKSQLESAIAAARAVEQGDKTAEAWEALQSAIATAEAAFGNSAIPQAGVDAVTSRLTEAVQAFNDSVDVAPDPEPSPEPEPDPGTDPEPGDQLEAGKTYTVPLSFTDASGKPSMAGNMLNPNATVQVNDGSCTVTLVVKAGDAYEFRALTLGADKAPTVLTRDADGNYVFTGTLDSIDGTVEVGFTYYVAAMNREMTHSAFATFDVSGATEDSATPEPDPEPSPEPDPEPEPSPEPSPDPKPEPDPNPDGDGGSDQTIVEGKEYPAAITWAKFGEMASRFMESEAIVVYQDGVFTVKLPVTATGAAASGFALEYDGTKYFVKDGAFELIFKELPASIEVALSSDNMPMTISDTITFDMSNVPNVDDGNGDGDNEVAKVDKTKLNEALAAAKELVKGSKTDEAWSALQSAIAAAEKAAANESMPQKGIDAVTAQLSAAVEAFKSSADKETPSGQYGMEVGKTYTASVSYEGMGSFAGMNDMLQQMVTKYFGTAVELNLLEDGTYDVVVYFGGSTGYDDAIGDLSYNGQAVKQSANRTYTINVPSLEDALAMTLHVGGTMNMDITYAMTVDTSTIALKNGDTPVASVDKSTLQNLIDQASAMTQGKKSDAAWESFQSTLAAARAVLNDANASQDAVNEAATSLKEAIDRFNASESVMFQVGHTYEVPIAFFKQGSVTEKSMAAQYFGDTALVRPQENDTFTVSFAATEQGLEYIKSLSYQGAAVSQSGNQFTLSIPTAQNDTVIPIDMSVTMMAQLGIGQSQVADMHLYLSQARDLGTGQSGVAASSSNLAKTGDGVAGLATLAGGTLVAGAAVAMTARRRMAQRK